MPFDGPSGYQVALRSFAAGIRPHRTLGVSAWAGKFRRLTAKGGAAEPGPWRNDRIPQLLGIMNALDDSHPAPLVVALGALQFGKSEAGLNWIFRTVHQAPTGILAVFPNEKGSKKWVRTRLNSGIAETPVIRALIPLGRKIDSGNTLTEKHYPGGVLYTGSANIPSDLASISVPKVLMEELDRWPLILEGEGDPIDLAMGRTSAFPGRTKVFANSTPTTEEESRIWRMWLSSTMERYFVPCPHCHSMQALSFDNLQWPDGKPAQCVLLCEECAAPIEERCKPDMLAAGEWRPEHPEMEELCKGFHLNGLYTPVGLGRSWVDHARAWEQARGNPAKTQVFYNTRRGEVVKSDKVKLAWEAVAARREPFKLRTIPAGVLLLTAGADIQGDRIEACIIGWCRGERAVVIDYTTFSGDPTRPEVWQALDDYLAAELLNSFGVKMRIQCAAIDSGNWQHEVVNFTRTRRGRNIIATKGSSIRTKTPIGRPSLVDVNYRGVSQKRGAEQYQIGVTVIKTTLYARLGADAEALPTDRHVRFSEDLPDEYFRQLTAERYDPQNGWQKHYDRNEALDITVMAIAAAMHQSVQIHRLRELDWQRLEQLYEPKDGMTKPPEPVLGIAPVPKRGGGFLPTTARVDNQN
jgi:phage terminase large subunit GpA-like protein